jgi:hypothetical protein
MAIRHVAGDGAGPALREPAAEMRVAEPKLVAQHEMAERIAFELNKETRTVEVAPDTPLLYGHRRGS